MVGMVVGLVRMILDFVYAEPACGDPDNRPEFFKSVNFTIYFEIYLIKKNFISF